jgi:hypothetical protein
MGIEMHELRPQGIGDHSRVGSVMAMLDDEEKRNKPFVS